MGADTERVYTLFLGPPEDEVEWNDEAVSGAYRFLSRCWRLAARLQEAPPHGTADEQLDRARHQTVKRVTEDLERFKFNTAIAALMELVNVMSKSLEEQSASSVVCADTFDTLLRLLHPMAPHLSEELWEQRGHMNSLLNEDWPEYDAEKLELATMTIVVQIDGKLRDRVDVESGADESTVRDAVMASLKVQEHLGDRDIVKLIHVPGRLVNLVTGARS